MSPIDRQTVAQNFGRSAADYDRVAALQCETRAELLDRLQPMDLKPQRVVDVGCGTGHGARALRKLYPLAEVLALDLALPMLQQARKQQPWFRPFMRIAADATQLPLADASVDLMFSNLCLQWCEDVTATLAEWGRVLKPGGSVLYSTFGLDSLNELRQAWAAVDDRPHLIDFLHIQQVGDAALKAGLVNPVMDRDLLRRPVDDPITLMRELKTLGANNAASNRQRGLTGRGRFAQMRAAYEHMRTPAGLPVSWEIIYGQAFGAELQDRTNEPRGTSLDQLRATLPSQRS